MDLQDNMYPSKNICKLRLNSKKVRFNFSTKEGYISRSELAECHWNNMMLEDREIIRVSKVFSKALNTMVDRKFRRAPDLSWKRTIHDYALAMKCEKNIDDTNITEEEAHDGYENDLLPENFPAEVDMNEILDDEDLDSEFFVES